MTTLNDHNAIESALLRLYRRNPSELPSASLDRRILAAARLAGKRRGEYRIPLALAASLLMGIGLSLQLRHYLPSAGLSGPASGRHEQASVLSPWEPFEVQVEPAAWPAFEKYSFLTAPSSESGEATQLAELDVADSFSTIGVQFPADLYDAGILPAEVLMQSGFSAGSPGAGAGHY